jgi:hypothetical protein
LPANQFRTDLAKVRQDFADWMNKNGTVPGVSYTKFDPPIPVTVSGSLFYDIDHRPGAVGPSDSKPETA